MKASEMFRNEVAKFENENKYFQCKELTYGANGYPKFAGKLRKAFYTTTEMTLEELENICDKYENATLDIIEWRQGQDFASGSNYLVSDLIQVTADMYGANYTECSSKDTDIQEMLKESISYDLSPLDLQDTINTYKQIVDNFVKAIKDCPADSFVMATGNGNYEIIKRKTNYLHIDSIITAIAIIFDSSDFEEDEY